ncbi:MAG: nucleoside recognition domain-containing protein [Phycisphaeraceae bacterium]
MTSSNPTDTQHALEEIDAIRHELGPDLGDQIVAAMYQRAETIANDVVDRSGRKFTLDERLDTLLTHPIWGWPIMLGLLALVFWLTVAGANVPSSFLAGLLIEQGGLSNWITTYLGLTAPAWLSVSGYELLHMGFAAAHVPTPATGLLVDGVYLCLAWVVSVMLPPMAIFFPMFTFLEDLGYLPRVAFNLDWLFKKSGAHGKQALTMAMGFGCNAAGVTACRIIDSPREKLIAILTNNFMICNGRFPTIIAIASLLVAGGVASGWLVGTLAAATMIGVVLLGIAFMFATSWVLSRTVLKGEASAFTLELPPYRRPALGRILYTSLIDRTIFVLGRACAVAAPAGAVIWLVAHIHLAGEPIATHVIHFLDPLGWALGLSGVILLAYLIAIPANEIVVPTLVMLLILVSGDAGLGLETGKMVEPDREGLASLLDAAGWTTLTSVCLLLFVLLHNPCATTIWTIWKETRSAKWTTLGALMPVAIGFATCAAVAGIWRLIA